MEKALSPQVWSSRTISIFGSVRVVVGGAEVREQTTQVQVDQMKLLLFQSVIRPHPLKNLPSFSDPHIPLVAREIMQRMIRQFAAEYTSKTTQDDLPLPNGTMKDQSLSPSSSASSSSPSPAPGPALSPNGTTSDGPQGGAAASAQNPVLSKLLLDQDAPLDLTVKKSPVEPPPGQQVNRSENPEPAPLDSL
ncbi:hypothetical protein WMY93_006500 [Mugilogobius chulae]|uniref:Uncharacterized protein n=1 Tax=Mugilogobius chulae TaxID=88201 RepID=A0AAW0PK25_9GOBI